MKRQTVLKTLAALAITAGIVITIFFAWMKLAPRHVPAGQSSLTTLGPESLFAFRDAFNASHGKVRIVALLSPT